MAPSEHTMTFAIVALAAAMVSTAATAQAGPDAAANRQRQLVDIVEREQARNGVYSVELIAPLSELAFLHQEAGDRAVASATVERVLQVIRANYGLYSLAQAPLILQLIANENAAGNNDTAWELEEELVSLAKRHPADLRTVPIFREVVRERMSLGSQELPLELVCRSHGSTEGCNARGVIVADALNNVGAAINVFLNNRLYGSPELRELEQKLIDWGSCDVARDSYRRLMFYDGETRESWLNRAATMVRAADGAHLLGAGAARSQESCPERIPEGVRAPRAQRCGAGLDRRIVCAAGSDLPQRAGVSHAVRSHARLFVRAHRHRLRDHGIRTRAKGRDHRRNGEHHGREEEARLLVGEGRPLPAESSERRNPR
jgi:hypothetical protein